MSTGEQIGNTVVFGRGEAPTVFADGVAQVLFGYPISKVFLSSSINRPSAEPGPLKDERRIEAVLVMPTLGLLEMCNAILTLAKSGESELLGFAQNSPGIIESALRNVVAGDTPVDTPPA